MGQNSAQKTRAECEAALSKMEKLGRMDTEREAFKHYKADVRNIWRGLS